MWVMRVKRSGFWCLFVCFFFKLLQMLQQHRVSQRHVDSFLVDIPAVRSGRVAVLPADDQAEDHLPGSSNSQQANPSVGGGGVGEVGRSYIWIVAKTMESPLPGSNPGRCHLGLAALGALESRRILDWDAAKWAPPLDGITEFSRPEGAWCRAKLCCERREEGKAHKDEGLRLPPSASPTQAFVWAHGDNMCFLVDPVIFQPLNNL